MRKDKVEEFEIRIAKFGFLNCFWHRECEEHKPNNGDGGQKKKSGVVSEVLGNDTGERVAHRRANASRRRNRTLGKIESPRAAREVGNHDHRNDAENSCADAIERLHRE